MREPVSWCQQADVTALAKALRRLIEDPVLREELGSSGQIFLSPLPLSPPPCLRSLTWENFHREGQNENVRVGNETFDSSRFNPTRNFHPIGEAARSNGRPGL